MQIRYVLGPAGCGKTFQCLAEIREQLAGSPEGPALLFLAPKQSTYQLERRLLEDPSLAGYTRLHILSFERLAHWILDALGEPAPAMLDEEGRVMVLRGLLARHRHRLKLFRASARLSGFAQQLSDVLRGVQENQLSPERLREIAAHVSPETGLAAKLEDLALLLEEYLAWLKTHQLLDSGLLLETAANLIRHSDKALPDGQPPFLWVDGFAELSHQELNLIQAVARRCCRTTLAFCMGNAGDEEVSWLSSWALTQETFKRCRKHLDSLPGAEIRIRTLSGDPAPIRFQANSCLRHLERFWTESQPVPCSEAQAGDSLGLTICSDIEGEAVVAAREVLRHVRGGGRYRDIGVLVRNLESHHEPMRRVFARYEIPYFLDRREAVSHHPLAELTRSALRTVAFVWQREDWFAGLKTGLIPIGEEDVDRLENEAIARGWKGAVWQQPLTVKDSPELTEWLRNLQEQVMPPFRKLEETLAAARNRPDGAQLAAALREFWGELKVEETLAAWAALEKPSGDRQVAGSVHLTVWEQMNSWLENIELAFAGEFLSLREWLPVLESGLVNLSVGVIPPALDQVVIGALNRSRNLDVDLAIVLGVNEGVFPARPAESVLLNETDRNELERMECTLGRTMRGHLARERHLAYLAFTRARRRLVLTAALQNAEGGVLVPSAFFNRVAQLFPSLNVNQFDRNGGGQDTLHSSELVVPLLKAAFQSASQPGALGSGVPMQGLPAIARILASVKELREPEVNSRLSPALADHLYGTVMSTSVSRIEQFAACPFRYFVYAGLRAEERERFELDIREQGSFQHDVLAAFHDELRKAGLRWRDITPASARERVQRIAEHLSGTYKEGLLQISEQTRFMTRVMTQSMQDFVETLVQWMREQYQFDPVEVELPFGTEPGAPGWRIPLDHGRALQLIGRIDRVDLCRGEDPREALCVVVDYKSSSKQLDSVLVANGIQLQLLAYLNVLRYWPNPQRRFGFERLIPAGVFYVNLRGKHTREQNRDDVLAHPEADRKLSYQHSGRFDSQALRKLDSRPGVAKGDQFNYRLTKEGAINGNCREALAPGELEQMLGSVETSLKRMGEQILGGAAGVSPYRKGSVTACDTCDYGAICRMDAWKHPFRVLGRNLEATQPVSLDPE